MNDDYWVKGTFRIKITFVIQVPIFNSYLIIQHDIGIFFVVLNILKQVWFGIDFIYVYSVLGFRSVVTSNHDRFQLQSPSSVYLYQQQSKQQLKLKERSKNIARAKRKGFNALDIFVRHKTLHRFDEELTTAVKSIVTCDLWCSSTFVCDISVKLLLLHGFNRIILVSSNL